MSAAVLRSAARRLRGRPLSTKAPGSSDEFIDANIQLALLVARKLKELQGTRSCIVFPDQPEKRRASQLFRTAIDTIEGVTVSSLDDVPTDPVNSFFKSIGNTLDFDFSDDNEDLWKSDEHHHYISSSTAAHVTLLL